MRSFAKIKSSRNFPNLQYPVAGQCYVLDVMYLPVKRKLTKVYLHDIVQNFLSPNPIKNIVGEITVKQIYSFEDSHRNRGCTIYRLLLTIFV